MAVTARCEAAARMTGKLGKARHKLLGRDLRQLLLCKARRIDHIAARKRKQFGTARCVAPAPDFLADRARQEGKLRIKRIEQG